MNKSNTVYVYFIIKIMVSGKRKAELSDSPQRDKKSFVEDSCEPMSHSDCQDCTAVTTSQCKQQCTATGERCKRRSIHPGTVPYCMQHISILAVRPDRWPATELAALRRAFVYVRDHVIRTSRYTTDSKNQRHIMFNKAVDKLSSMCTVSARLFGGSEDIVTHTTPFFTFPERIDRSLTITDRDSEIVLDKILQHYDAGAPTVRHLQESHRWIDDRHHTEEQKYDASKTYFIHCHDIGHTEHIVKKFELQHVVLIGTFERWIRNGAEDKHDIFMRVSNLQSIKFLLPWVTHVGHKWMYACRRLENPSFIGMSSLLEVGRHWMNYCRTLEAPSFTGLSGLLEVGSYWMAYCSALENPSFTGLSSLKNVNNGWMSQCNALENPRFTGLSSLRGVGSDWMSSCATLKNPSFVGLLRLKSVHSEWLSNCCALENPSFAGLSSLKTVGRAWMSECNALKNPSFTGLLRLDKIFAYWMAYCHALVDPKFDGLSSLTNVHNNWLYKCNALENPSFVGLSSLKNVDHDWMSECNALRNPSFAGLSSLLTVGNRWMSWCNALEKPNFLGLWSLVKVGDHWMSWCGAKHTKFTELSSLTDLSSYSTLLKPNFTGLSSLVDVGSNWMYGCADYMDINFTELSSLTYVGPYGHDEVQEYFMKQTTQWSIRAVEI